jgi:formamidopyrimidine-DNA glycosylase
MPELPEVETTVRGLKREIIGKKILDVWSDYHKKTAHGHKENLKNKKYFEVFKDRILGKSIIDVERRGKNILIRLSGNLTILTHMKMTGHFLVGNFSYSKKTDSWEASEESNLKDPFNRFLHFVMSLTGGKKLALSDVRKFAKIIVFETDKTDEHLDIRSLGPDPLAQNMTFAKFKKRLIGKSGPIKSILMDQRVFAGIGNIYSDEMLWSAGIHPEENLTKIDDKKLRLMYLSMKKILKQSIILGGDSTSDYRNIKGEKGGFQKRHKVYRCKGEICLKKGCGGTIQRIVVRGRSAHFCPVHQK